MPRDEMAIETSRNEFVDGVVSERTFCSIGNAYRILEEKLVRRTVDAGSRYQEAYIDSDTRPPNNRSWSTSRALEDDLYYRLITETNSFKTSSKLKRWAITTFGYRYRTRTIYRSLKRMVSEHFSRDPERNLSEIGELKVMDTIYSVKLQVQSVGPVGGRAVDVGVGSAVREYFAEGVGTSPPSASEGPATFTSPIEGKKYRFKLKFEKMPLAALEQ